MTSTLLKFIIQDIFWVNSTGRFNFETPFVIPSIGSDVMLLSLSRMTYTISKSPEMLVYTDCLLSVLLSYIPKKYQAIGILRSPRNV